MFIKEHQHLIKHKTLCLLDINYNSYLYTRIKKQNFKIKDVILTRIRGQLQDSRSSNNESQNNDIIQSIFTTHAKIQSNPLALQWRHYGHVLDTILVSEVKFILGRSCCRPLYKPISWSLVICWCVFTSYPAICHKKWVTMGTEVYAKQKKIFAVQWS